MRKEVVRAVGDGWSGVGAKSKRHCPRHTRSAPSPTLRCSACMRRCHRHLQKLVVILRWPPGGAGRKGPGRRPFAGEGPHIGQSVQPQHLRSQTQGPCSATAPSCTERKEHFLCPVPQCIVGRPLSGQTESHEDPTSRAFSFSKCAPKK